MNTQSTRQKTPLAISGVALAAALVVCIATRAPAQSRALNPGIIPPEASAYGKSYGQWAASWWTWAMEIPAAINPVADPDGSFASVDQDGPVWFLAGNFGGTTVRHATIPRGKALFFPIVNTFFGFLEGETVDLEAARAYVKEQIDSASNLACEIDDVPVANLSAYREQSPEFSFVIPDDNVFGVPELGGLTVSPTVDEGIYLMVAPLKPGKHKIHFHGCLNDCEFELDVTYHLTIE